MSARDGYCPLSQSGGHFSRRRLVGGCPRPDLSAVVLAPRVDLAVTGQADRVVGAARHVHHRLASQRSLDQRRRQALVGRPVTFIRIGYKDRYLKISVVPD